MSIHLLMYPLTESTPLLVGGLPPLPYVFGRVYFPKAIVNGGVQYPFERIDTQALEGWSISSYPPLYNLLCCLRWIICLMGLVQGLFQPYPGILAQVIYLAFLLVAQA